MYITSVCINCVYAINTVDCEWDDWIIGECSKTCGGGLMTKTRQVLVNEDNGGNACVGSNSVTESCNDNECPGK